MSEIQQLMYNVDAAKRYIATRAREAKILAHELNLTQGQLSYARVSTKKDKRGKYYTVDGRVTTAMICVIAYILAKFW